MSRIIAIMLVVGYLYAGYWMCSMGLGWLAFLLFVGQWYSNSAAARKVLR